MKITETQKIEMIDTAKQNHWLDWLTNIRASLLAILDMNKEEWITKYKAENELFVRELDEQISKLRKDTNKKARIIYMGKKNNT